MPAVTYLTADPVGEFRWVSEASALGLAPGAAPLYLPTSLGNGQPFTLTGRDADGCLTYEQALGCLTLTVFND